MSNCLVSGPDRLCNQRRKAASSSGICQRTASLWHSRDRVSCSHLWPFLGTADGWPVAATWKASSTFGTLRRGQRLKPRRRGWRADNRRDRGEVSRTASEIRRKPEGRGRLGPPGHVESKNDVGVLYTAVARQPNRPLRSLGQAGKGSGVAGEITS
jgi:hypothetical protein